MEKIILPESFPLIGKLDKAAEWLKENHSELGDFILFESSCAGENVAGKPEHVSGYYDSMDFLKFYAAKLWLHKRGRSISEWPKEFFTVL